MEGLCVETVAGDERSQDFAWNFRTYSKLVTQYEYSLHTVWHSKYSVCRASSAYRSGTSLNGCFTCGVQASYVCAFHCNPTNSRTVRSSRDTPHRLAYCWLFNKQNLQGQSTAKGFPDTFSTSLILIYGVVL
jgi:hypothetical protein